VLGDSILRNVGAVKSNINVEFFPGSRTDLSWADHVNYTVQRAFRTLHFVMRVVKKGIKYQIKVYKSLVRPILEYGSACWEPYRERQINALDRVHNKAAKFEHHTWNLWRTVGR
jgi:hypothetical protein